jgi:tetratricopeptide (TPR) repeat protein
MLNAVMMGQNLYQVLTNNPISAQPVIDAGVAYVRSHPNSDSATEVYKVLASAYEEKGMFEKALAYHELAGAPKETIAAVKESAAKAYLNAAAKSSNRGAREYYLTAAVDEAPNSETAAEATKKLADLAKDDNRGLRMSKQFLMENPEIYGANGLGLKASLFDGNLGNMELAEKGVNLVATTSAVHYQTPWALRSQLSASRPPRTDSSSAAEKP